MERVAISVSFSTSLKDKRIVKSGPFQIALQFQPVIIMRTSDHNRMKNAEK